MRESTSTESERPYFSQLPLQFALIATVAVILYTGFFPGQALDLARASVEGLSAFGGTATGFGQ